MRDVLGWYYINWYIKRVLIRIMEAGLEVYGGMAPQKELTFEHWVRVISASCMGDHGASESGQGRKYGAPFGKELDALYES
jgi:hypothetical protein